MDDASGLDLSVDGSEVSDGRDRRYSWVRLGEAGVRISQVHQDMTRGQSTLRVLGQLAQC